MSKPNSMFLPLDDGLPELGLQPNWSAPSVSPMAPLDGCEEDMKAIGAALLNACTAFAALHEANAAHSKIACHIAANKLDALISRALVARVRNVTNTVRART